MRDESDDEFIRRMTRSGLLSTAEIRHLRMLLASANHLATEHRLRMEQDPVLA